MSFSKILVRFFLNESFQPFVSFYFRHFCQWPHSVDWGMGLKHLFFAGWVDWADVGTEHFCPLRKQKKKYNNNSSKYQNMQIQNSQISQKMYIHSTETASLMLTCS